MNKSNGLIGLTIALGNGLVNPYFRTISQISNKIISANKFHLKFILILKIPIIIGTFAVGYNLGKIYNYPHGLTTILPIN